MTCRGIPMIKSNFTFDSVALNYDKIPNQYFDTWNSKEHDHKRQATLSNTVDVHVAGNSRIEILCR